MKELEGISKSPVKKKKNQVENDQIQRDYVNQTLLSENSKLKNINSDLQNELQIKEQELEELYEEVNV